MRVEFDLSKCTKEEVELVQLIRGLLENRGDGMPGLNAMVLELALAKLTKNEELKNKLDAVLDELVDDAIKTGRQYLAKTVNHKTH